MGGPRFAADGVRWRLASGGDVDGARRLAERSLEALRTGRLSDRKSGRRKALYPVPPEAPGEPGHLLKVTRYAGGQAWWRSLRGSKARHELALAEALQQRGLPAPVPVAAGEERHAGRLRACYLLVRVLPGASDLAQRWPSLSTAERRRAAGALGALVRDLQAAGLDQDDLAPNNILVDGQELLAIDFERARLGAGAVGEGARLRALAKLDRRVGPEVGASQRMRFLRAYAGGDSRAARSWWRRLAAERARAARRDTRRWARSAGRPGRRIQRVAVDGWRGLARRDADVAALLAQAELRATGVTAGAGAFALACDDLGTRAARGLWGRAHALWDGRGLGPRPLALLRRDGATLLFLERSPDARNSRPEDAAAIRVLQRRLAAAGRIDGELPADAVAILERAAAPRALLLDGRRWRPRS
jgi:tRNA A-37 threonylcarbamoyl transferase component Bud32